MWMRTRVVFTALSLALLAPAALGCTTARSDGEGGSASSGAVTASAPAATTGASALAAVTASPAAATVPRENPSDATGVPECDAYLTLFRCFAARKGMAHDEIDKTAARLRDAFKSANPSAVPTTCRVNFGRMSEHPSAHGCPVPIVGTGHALAAASVPLSTVASPGHTTQAPPPVRGTANATTTHAPSPPVTTVRNHPPPPATTQGRPAHPPTGGCTQANHRCTTDRQCCSPMWCTSMDTCGTCNARGYVCTSNTDCCTGLFCVASTCIH